MRLLILIVLGIVIYRLARHWFKAGAGNREWMTGRQPEQIDDVMIKDPQCGVYFPRREGVAHFINGEEILFCSQKCKAAYLTQKSDK